MALGLNNDKLQVAKVDFNASANIKILISSETTYQFDPLGLVILITIKGKILINKKFFGKLDLECELCADIVKEW